MQDRPPEEEGCICALSERYLYGGFLSSRKRGCFAIILHPFEKKLKEEIPQDIDAIEAPVASDSPGMFMSGMDVLFNQGLSIDSYHIERFFLPAFAEILPIQFETVTWVEDIVGENV